MQLTLTSDDLYDYNTPLNYDRFKPEVREVIWLVGEAKYLDEITPGNFHTIRIIPTKWGLTRNQIHSLEQYLERAFPEATGIEIEGAFQQDSIWRVTYNFEPPEGGQNIRTSSVSFRIVGDILEDVVIDGRYPPNDEEQNAALLCSYALEGVKDLKSTNLMIAEKLLKDRNHWKTMRVLIEKNPLIAKETLEIMDRYHKDQPFTWNQ